MYMKKTVILFAFLCAALVSQAQDAPVSQQKHSVNTNSFWANWFVQANVVGTSFWGSQEDKSLKLSQLFKPYRTNLGFSIALGKWFTPGIGLRTKFNGLWGRSVISEDKAMNASRYWTLQEQALFNLSNLLMGYNETRVWNFIPYIGAGVGRNLSYNTYGMGLSAGLLNTFQITPKLAVNLDISYGIYEPGFDGFQNQGSTSHSLKNKDRMVNVEVGLTYRLGRSTWQRAIDTDAQGALAESEIDALNAQLADALAENERLSQELAQQQTPQPAPQPVTQETKTVSAPVSVFFNLNKATIASQRELQNVAELVAIAQKQNARLLVTGYADSQTGNADRNQQLSQERANAVADEIVRMGFPRERLDIQAAGGVDTLKPQPYNRRVTVEIK